MTLLPAYSLYFHSLMLSFLMHAAVVFCVYFVLLLNVLQSTNKDNKVALTFAQCKKCVYVVDVLASLEHAHDSLLKITYM